MAHDLRDDQRAEEPGAPANLEAEQAILGAILFDNAIFATLPDGLGPDHFYEPFHGRLFRAIANAIKIGLAADPTSIAEEFRADPAYKELGGFTYLANLLDKSPASSRAAGYAEVVVDLAIRRELIRLGQALAMRAQREFIDVDGERIDAKALAEAAQRDLTAAQLQTARDKLTPLSEAVGSVATYLADPNPVSGVKSGLAPLDLQLGPLMAGDLVLLGGRPSMGKSAVAGAISMGVASPSLSDWMAERDLPHRKGAGVIEIHGEMNFGGSDGGQSARRHLSNLGFHKFGPDFPNYKAMRERAGITPRQLDMITEALLLFQDVPIVGIKRTGLRIAALRTLIRRQAAEWERQDIPLGLVTIDHVGLLRPDGKASSRYEAQTEIAIALKELADELGVPIVALVQLSRDIERRDDKRPQLSDLRDSGAWEENADAVIFVYREAYYAQRQPKPDNDAAWNAWSAARISRIVELNLAKLREGDTGKGAAELWADLAHNAIRGVCPTNAGDLI